MKVKLLFILVYACAIPSVIAQRDYSDSEITKLVLLGTGDPTAIPDRSGSSVAIVVNSKPYIIDFGPGVIRRLAAVSENYGNPDEQIKGLDLKNTTRAFLTHLHSDHSAGYPDLILTPWNRGGGGRDTPLEVYGPEGINKMTEYILNAYSDDIKYRLYGTQPINNQGWRVNSHEILEEGIVYKDENVIVEAFPAPHGTWPNAWSYRFSTPDKVIVVSGDTTPSDKLMMYAKGADILVHGAYSEKLIPKEWHAYYLQNHTSASELANIAKQAQPKLLVLYHQMPWKVTEKIMLDEILEIYQGRVIFGNDLDKF